MRKNILKILVIFIVGMVGGIFADQIAWPYLVERPLFYQYGLEANPVYMTETKEVIVQENTALTDAINRVSGAVIGVETKTSSNVFQGSGLILSSDGLAVTLAELVPQGGDFTFFIDGKAVSFQILKRDLDKNLALIKIEKDNLPTVGFADLTKVKLGERVFLAASYFGSKGISQKKAVNEGVVTFIAEDLFYTNIFEVASFAGTPLFNIKGEAVGINTVDFWGRISAIPIDEIKEFAGF